MQFLQQNDRFLSPSYLNLFIKKIGQSSIDVIDNKVI